MSLNYAGEPSDSLIKGDLVNTHFYDNFGDGHIIKKEDFNTGVIVSPLQLIKGKVPGLNIRNIKGNAPNPEFQVQLRGISTLNLSTRPLFVIDDIIVENIEFIPFESIEYLEVLTNISETARFGSRGVNGNAINLRKKFVIASETRQSAYK